MTLTAKQLIDTAASAPFMAWKARAAELIGDDTPSTKAEILAVLKDMAPEEEPEPEVIHTPQGAVEVDLKVRGFVPSMLMDEDGNFVPQKEITQKIPGGPVLLCRKDAELVLMDGRAVPTSNTFRQMK